jgi:hypothetical protein
MLEAGFARWMRILHRLQFAVTVLQNSQQHVGFFVDAAPQRKRAIEVDGGLVEPHFAVQLCALGCLKSGYVA